MCFYRGLCGLKLGWLDGCVMDLDLFVVMRVFTV